MPLTATGPRSLPLMTVGYRGKTAFKRAWSIWDRVNRVERSRERADSHKARAVQEQKFGPGREKITLFRNSWSDMGKDCYSCNAMQTSITFEVTSPPLVPEKGENGSFVLIGSVGISRVVTRRSRKSESR
ncbi:hypothetical protein C8R44DRAFT_754125 [Mycena epipterygia]|nr:hypothetical protein C8R44DRAFT_754125 [Mycena epipterygia]